MKRQKTSMTYSLDDAPLTADELKTGRRPSKERIAMFKRAAQRGRPAGRTKDVTSVSFDKDVLAQLRKQKGWQTWLNGVAKAMVNMDSRC